MDPYYWLTKDPVEYPSELVNNLSESDSDRKPKPKDEYYCVNEDLEWGGELDEGGGSDVDHYIMIDEKEVEFKSDGKCVDGVLCIDMELIQLPPF